MKTMKIKIDSLVTENLQTRAEMHEDCIADYAETYRDKPNDMPPITVFYDSMLDKYYLADGFHRVCACKQNGSDTILANVTEGNYDDALRFAVKANAKNGIHRSNADKQYALAVAWANWRILLGDEPPKGKTDNKPNGLPSGEQLAALCCVSARTADYFITKQIERNLRSTGVSSEQLDPVVSEILDNVPDGITVTKRHLEERNPTVRALLKEGKDRFGIDIPERLTNAFLTREPQAMLQLLRGLRKKIEERRLAGDLAFAHFGGFAMTHFNNLIRTIECGEVYCVCPVCRGASCIKCFGHGFMTHDQHKQYLKEKEAGLL